MSTESRDLPYVTDDYSDADRDARMRSSRHGRAYFIGVRFFDDEPEYLVAPLADFRRFHTVGWLLDRTYGEPRDPDHDYFVYFASDYEDAVLEAALRLHRVGIATAIAVGYGEDETHYVVMPLRDFPPCEDDGLRIRDLFLPE